MVVATKDLVVKVAYADKTKDANVVCEIPVTASARILADTIVPLAVLKVPKNVYSHQAFNGKDKLAISLM